ncbi:MAG: 50S ribosomal protein L22 [Candidatus Bathyarchaeia archaeon]
MPVWGYSAKTLDPERTVRCAGREIRISPKAATEICRAIRGMKLPDAKKLLEDVAEKRRSIPYKHYKKEVPHRPHQGFHAGRYPQKAARRIYRLLEELEANAEYRGLDTEKIRIAGAVCHRGMKVRKFIPRAFGRASPYFNVLTHVELVGYEAE